jgi:hypothetical protein
VSDELDFVFFSLGVQQFLLLAVTAATVDEAESHAIEEALHFILASRRIFGMNVLISARFRYFIFYTCKVF